MGRILIFWSMVLVFALGPFSYAQSDSKSMDSTYQKIDVSDPLSSISSSIRSELSSVVAAPTTPLILKGVAQGFLVLGVCCVYSPSTAVVLCGNSQSISWYDKPATVDLSQFNTLTVTFSSLPPGPAYWSLSGGTGIGNYSIDNTSIVLDKTTCPNCFSSGGTLNTTFSITQNESWTTVGTSSSKIS